MNKYFIFALFLFMPSYSFSQDTDICVKNIVKNIIYADNINSSFKINDKVYIRTHGIEVGNGLVTKITNKQITVKILSGKEEIYSPISTIHKEHIRLLSSIPNSILIALNRFNATLKQYVHLSPIFLFIIVLIIIVLSNFIKTLLIPTSELSWRKKIINDISKLNKQSIEYVKNELLELPHRKNYALAQSYVYNKSISELINVKGVGKKTIEKIYDAGFNFLGEFENFRSFVHGIGATIEQNIIDFIDSYIEESFSKIEAKTLDYSDEEIIEYFKSYKEQLLQQKITLNGDINDIVELSEQLNNYQQEVLKMSFIDKINIYKNRQIHNIKHPFQNIRITINFLINSMAFYMLPIPLYIIPGVKIYHILFWGWWSVFISAFYFLIKYNFISEKSITGLGQEIDPENLKEQRLQLEALKMSVSIGITTPLVRIIPNESYNAFAAGGRFVKSVVCFHSALINDFHWDEIRAIMGHEMTHLKNGDSRVFSTFDGTVSIVEYISYLGFKLAYFLYEIPIINIFSCLFSKLNYFIMYIIRFITIFTKFSIGRSQEYRADIGGATLTSYADMRNSLISLLNGPKDNNYYTEFRSSYIIDVSNNFSDFRSFTESIFATHPPIEKRISALENNIKTKSDDIQQIENLKKYL